MKSDFTSELESKRIENVQTRRIVWVLAGTALVTLVLSNLNHLHPNGSTRWIVGLLVVPQGYWFYRLLQNARKIKSILPPDMESKRIRIGKRHNSLMLILMLAVGAAPIATIWAGAGFLPGYHNAIVVTALLLMVVTGVFGLYRIFQYENVMCRKLGYLCPNCQKPLYEVGAATYLNGLCPKCKKNIFADPRRT